MLCPNPNPRVRRCSGGSLAIEGADEDAGRVADFIREHAKSIDEIVVTLDTHQRMHIAHGVFWVDPQGKHPDPFTIISAEDIEKGKWKTTIPEYQGIAANYAKQLEARGKYKICIWPEHCIVGTSGHNVRKPIIDAISTWVDATLKEVRWVTKAESIFTEMYSGLQAEVPTEDRRTQLNTNLVDFIKGFSRVLVCGEALSHCVNFTVRDLMRYYEEGHHKVTVLTDCSTSVAGFENEGQQFLKDMEALGVRLMTSKEAGALLKQ